MIVKLERLLRFTVIANEHEAIQKNLTQDSNSSFLVTFLWIATVVALPRNDGMLDCRASLIGDNKLKQHNMIQLIIQNIFWFVILISIIVFIHEFGHYYVAKKCGVKIETFSIGFGKELIGRTDKNGVRWKFCIVPFGGYVKMFGDRNEASMPDLDESRKFTDKEKAQSFIYKNIYQKMAIVAAGPAANFILGIFLFTILFKVNGYNATSSVIDLVVKDSPAMSAGLKQGDKIMVVDGNKINDFVDLQNAVAPAIGKKLEIIICRGDQNIHSDIVKFEDSCNDLYEGFSKDGLEILSLNIATKEREVTNLFGDVQKVAIIGVSPVLTQTKEIGVFESFIKANQETYRFSKLILVTTKDLILGKRNLEELSGPIKIAKYSGKTVELGLTVVIWFMAIISINLGVINLLPIPVLDGGHLFFYIYEAIFRKPLPKKVQETGFRIGFAMLITLMLFTTFNDLSQIFGK